MARGLIAGGSEFAFELEDGLVHVHLFYPNQRKADSFSICSTNQRKYGLRLIPNGTIPRVRPPCRITINDLPKRPSSQRSPFRCMKFDCRLT